MMIHIIASQVHSSHNITNLSTTTHLPESYARTQMSHRLPYLVGIHVQISDSSCSLFHHSFEMSVDYLGRGGNITYYFIELNLQGYTFVVENNSLPRPVSLVEAKNCNTMMPAHRIKPSSNRSIIFFKLIMRLVSW